MYDPEPPKAPPQMSYRPHVCSQRPTVVPPPLSHTPCRTHTEKAVEVPEGRKKPQAPPAPGTVTKGTWGDDRHMPQLHGQLQAGHEQARAPGRKPHSLLEAAAGCRQGQSSDNRVRWVA